MSDGNFLAFFLSFVLQKNFKETLRKFQLRIQEKENNLQELRNAVESYKASFEKNNCWQLEELIHVQLVCKHVNIVRMIYNSYFIFLFLHFFYLLVEN